LERVLGWPIGELLKRDMSPAFYGDLIMREKQGKFQDWVSPGWHNFKTRTKGGPEVDISWASVAMSDGTIIGIGQVVSDSTRVERDGKIGEKVQLLEIMNDRFKIALIETHHRVKNNLQTLSALIDLQTVANEGDGEEGLSRLKLHVRCLAAIHDLLTRDTRVGAFTDTISAKETLEELIPLLERTAGAEEIESDLEEILLPLRMGMSLAVLVNELVTNAVKHGGKRVEMKLYVEGSLVNLQVCDDGSGFPPDFDPNVSANIGLNLIERMSRWDLQGETKYFNQSGGGCVHVTFPLPQQSIAA